MAEVPQLALARDMEQWENARVIHFFSLLENIFTWFVTHGCYVYCNLQAFNGAWLAFRKS